MKTTLNWGANMLELPTKSELACGRLVYSANVVAAARMLAALGAACRGELVAKRSESEKAAASVVVRIL